MIIILGVGHNAKAHAIAYMPMVVAGVILVYQKRYVIGGLLTMIAAALEINANHFQMTYYLLFLLLVIAVYYKIQYVKEKDFKGLWKATGIFALAAILAVGANATNLMATSEYAKYSTRSDSELSFAPDGKKAESSNAMSYEYITEYSYGIAESLNLIAPRLFGGSNHENTGEGSPMYDFVLSQGASPAEAKDFASSVPTYWGDQPIVAAPAYIGAIVFFLFVLSMFVDKRKIKYAFLGGAILSLLLSWGKHFPLLTDFFIDFVPMYNKFRAVSSIQVLLELCMPVMAILGLQAFFKAEEKRAFYGFMENGSSNVRRNCCFVPFQRHVPIYRRQRQHVFADVRRNGTTVYRCFSRTAQGNVFVRFDAFQILILLAAGTLWLFLKNKLSELTAIIIVGILMVGDLFFVDKNYVNNDSFVSARQADLPFEATPADEHILRDTTHYRVFEVKTATCRARVRRISTNLLGVS